MTNSVVVMGVAGCGKSSLGVVIARALEMKIIEGDDFHSDVCVTKMGAGIALTDADRAGWLVKLCGVLKRHPEGVVLTCSALKRSYRDQLRSASPGLQFVFLEINPEQARKRVVSRSKTHFFASSLIDSQFEALEVPVNESHVLHVDALAPLFLLQEQVIRWINTKEGL